MQKCLKWRPDLWDFGGGLAEVAGEALATVREDHEGTHVRLAAGAPDGAQLPQVDDGRRVFAVLGLGQRAHHQSEGDAGLLLHVGGVGHSVHGRPDKRGA